MQPGPDAPLWTPVSSLITHVRVRFQECDPLGHVNNATFISYLEQAAFDHAAILGWPVERLRDEIGAVFIVRRHEITFHQPAFEDQVLQILTWPGELTGARAVRMYEMRRIDADPYAVPPSRIVPGPNVPHFDKSELVVSGQTLFAFVHLERGRPVRVPDLVAQGFLMEEPA